MMDDLISRAEAIRIAEQGQVQGFEWQFKKLCDLPSVQPRKGKWILVDPDTDKGVQCSECSGWSEYCTDFCPHCGARMDSSNE